MTTAIYARQSINKKDSISIETQIEICRREIANGDAVKIYTDKGFSGKNTQRPDFQRLIDDINNGDIQKIVVYRLDRISRSVVDFANIIDTLNAHNVDFVSANEKFDTSTPVGKAMLYIVMVFAQLERETIAERIKDNYYQRGADGVWLGGPAPFGYENTKITLGGKKVATIKETEDIDLVKRIFKEYAKDGVSLGEIAKRLTEERGEMWNNIKLSRILHNPAYVMADADIYTFYLAKKCNIKSDISEFNGINGLNIYGKRDRSVGKYNHIEDHIVTVGFHNGVVPSELWLTCQKKLDTNRQIKNSGKGKHTWLTGLIKCGYCGYALTVRSVRNNKKYLLCSGKYLGLCTAELGVLCTADIEDVVSQKIKDYVNNFTDCKISYSENHNDIEINAIKINLVKTDTEINNIVNNLANANDIMMKYANLKIVELDKQKTELLKRLNDLNIKKSQNSPSPTLATGIA